MEKKANKNTSILIPITWTITTAIWIATVFISVGSDGTSVYLIAMQCCAAISSFAAAIANFIRYRRDKIEKTRR